MRSRWTTLNTLLSNYHSRPTVAVERVAPTDDRRAGAARPHGLPAFPSAAER
ncbi:MULTISPECIES: hypothetical protein [Actinoalloteichus]|uniref:hypothetical protein n=1 Tax=Actinoalloteichus TaxID=65496 RepID=UPI0012FBDA73|nr:MULTISPECIES: hypothetical protein [Actinoalloteichus]